MDDGAKPLPPDCPPPGDSFAGGEDELWLRLSLSSPQQPGVKGRLGSLDVLRIVGWGGMGVVLEARDRESAKKVAVKLLKPDLLADAGAVHKFMVEARHMQRLDHPRILKVLGVFEEPGRNYFTMPHVEGGSLAKRTESGKPLDPGSVLRIARQLADALGYAHGRGLIHRDLKPGNVLVDEAGRVFLTDFGLARTVFNDSVVDPSRSQREGTAPYMAPEVAAGQAGDTRCDIYGLGTLLYDMLTGRPPYEGASREEIIRKILDGPPVQIDTVNPKAPPPLAKVAQGAMERELRDRYATMADVLADLDRVEHGAMPLGPRHSAGFASRWLKGKHRRAVWIGAAAVALALAVVVWPVLFPPLRLARKIEFAQVTKWAHVQLGDFNGDGELDFYALTDKRDALYVLMPDRTLLKPWNKPAGADLLGLALVTDVDRDGKDEAFLNWTEGTNLIVQVLNQNLYPIKTFRALGSETRLTNDVPSRSSLFPQAVLDLENDGRREFIAEIVTGKGKSPRGLLCFDYESGAQRWFYETAPTVREPHFRDLNGDGNADLVFGSYSVSKDYRLADGTDDLHAYLYAVTHAGAPIWPPCELGGPHTEVRPLLVKLDGLATDYVYAWVSGWPESHPTKEDPEVGRVVRLTLDGKPDGKEYDAGVALLSCVSADLGLDGQTEILATDRLGFLHVLDLDLKPKRRKVRIATTRFDRMDLRIAAVAPLAKDPRPHVILTSSQRENVSEENPRGDEGPSNVRFYHDNEIVVLNSKLEVLTRRMVDRCWKEHPGWTVKVVDMDHDGRLEIVSLADQAFIFQLR